MDFLFRLISTFYERLELCHVVVSTLRCNLYFRPMLVSRLNIKSPDFGSFL